MTEKVIHAIEKILARGERVELLKGPDGEIKVLRIRRETVAVSKKPRPAFRVRLDNPNKNGYNETRGAVSLVSAGRRPT